MSVQRTPWLAPAVVVAAVVLITAGFVIGGPVLGFLAAVVAAVTIVTIAIGPGRPTLAAGATRRLLLAVLPAIAGLALILAGSGTAEIIGWGLLGVALTIAVSLVFLEIGYGEDRERARR
jgi:hypothetical protein